MNAFSRTTAVLLLLACQAAARADFVVGFDDVAAPQVYSSVTPGGALGPTYARSGVTFTGGVVLNGSSFAGAATSSPNLYATSDNIRLADGSRLPGVVAGTLAVPAFGISLDVFNALPNANAFASFTLTAFAADGATLFARSVSLFDFQLGRLEGASSTAIDHFTVTTTQRPGGINFSVDTVAFTTAPVPEPSSLALAGVAAILGLGCLRRSGRAAS